jgi:hypothetical protein
MENKSIKVIALVSGQILISQIEEVTSELGEPDCKISYPYVINVTENNTLVPFLNDVTGQSTFMISSDKILTLADPKPTMLELYQSLTK